MSDEPYYETTLLSEEDDYNETTLLSEEDDYNETTLLSEEDDYCETTLLSEEDDYNETTLLSEEDDYNETTLLCEKASIPPGVNISGLLNIITREEVQITVTPFTVGSEAGNVDYYIPNPTVSRHHMDIVLEGADYYIVDKNSTNGTTLDGSALSPENPVKLYNGALIQVSEELFQFNITGGRT